MRCTKERGCYPCQALAHLLDITMQNDRVLGVHEAQATGDVKQQQQSAVVTDHLLV